MAQGAIHPVRHPLPRGQAPFALMRGVVAAHLAAFWLPVTDGRSPRCRRGALAVFNDPAEIVRHGVPLPLSPTEVALLSLLVRRGRAAHAAIAEVFEQACASMASLDVITHRIRRKFAAIGAPNPIQTRRNWGLVLRVEPDSDGSTALWIGDSPRPDRRYDFGG